jgi:hypothetical protein
MGFLIASKNSAMLWAHRAETQTNSDCQQTSRFLNSLSGRTAKNWVKNRPHLRHVISESGVIERVSSANLFRSFSANIVARRA